MLLRLLSARTHPGSANRRGFLLLVKRVFENLGDVSSKMERKCKSPPSWVHRSSPADFFTEKTADTFADCPPEETTTRIVTRRTQSKSTRLLKRMTSAGSAKRLGRLDSSRNSSHSPTEDVGREGPSELEETSFVAARSESVLSTAPVLCPPVPAEWETSHHGKYEQKSDDFSESSFAPTNSFVEHCGQGTTSPDDDLDSTNGEDMRRLQHKAIVHHRPSAAASAREPDDPTDTSFAARSDSHAGYFYELCKLPSLEKLFDYSTASQTSFTEDAIFTTQQSFGDPSVDQQTSNQYQIGTAAAPRGSLTTIDGRRKRSILISGEIQFCPEEGILTREPNCSVQAPARDSQDYKSTRLEFKNASNDRTTLTQRMLLWGGRILRKKPLRKTFPRRQQDSEPKRLVQWGFLGGCLRRPHIANASTQASPASVLAT